MNNPNDPDSAYNQMGGRAHDEAVKFHGGGGGGFYPPATSSNNSSSHEDYYRNAYAEQFRNSTQSDYGGGVYTNTNSFSRTLTRGLANWLGWKGLLLLIPLAIAGLYLLSLYVAGKLNIPEQINFKTHSVALRSELNVKVDYSDKWNVKNPDSATVIFYSPDNRASFSLQLLQNCPAEPLEAANGCWITQRETKLKIKHTGSSGDAKEFGQYKWLITYWDGTTETFITSYNEKVIAIVIDAVDAKTLEENYDKFFKIMLNSLRF